MGLWVLSLSAWGFMTWITRANLTGLQLKTSDYLTFAIGLLTAVLIPLVALLIRIVIRQARVEDRLATVVADFKETTREMQASMREDRQSTNRRLTWLEQHLYVRGKE